MTLALLFLQIHSHRWLRAHIFSIRSIVTVAVEETKMQQSVFVAQVLVWVMLLGVSIMKETQSPWEGCTGDSDISVAFVFERRGGCTGFLWLFACNPQAHFRMVSYFIKNKRKENKALKITGPFGSEYRQNGVHYTDREVVYYRTWTHSGMRAGGEEPQGQ